MGNIDIGVSIMRTFLFLLSVCCFGQAWFPSVPNAIGSNLSTTAQVIDATGEKVSFCGSVWTPDNGTKSIRKVGILFGSSNTKAGGSALTLSLQDPSTSAGPPMQPDGTQDQTVAIGNAAIVNSTFLLTGALSADRSTAFGANLCVVVEFDGAGRLGADSIQIAAIQKYAQTVVPTTALFTASWADSARLPIVLFEFSDGSYGTLDGAMIFSAYNTAVAYNSGSAADEYALKFSPAVSGTINGVQVNLTAATSADFDIVLYQGTTALATVSVDQNTWTPSVGGFGFEAFPPTAVSAGTTYYLAIKPTTANNVTLGGVTVASNSYLGATPQGTGWVRSSRVDGGSWTDTTTIMPNISFRLTASGSGSSSAGSYVVAQ